jgi:hypothetical protein
MLHAALSASIPELIPRRGFETDPNLWIFQ